MFNFIKSNSQIFFGFIFGMYFLFTLSNAVDINNTVSIAVLLTIIIYIQSIGTFFYFYKKNGKPRLQDWIRVGLFITLVLDFMKIVNKANGQDSITFIVNSVSLNDSSFVLIIIIFAFISLDFAWITYNTFKKNKPSNEQFIINRKDWIFIILIVSTLFQSYLLFSGVTGFGSKQSSGILSLVKMISEYLNPFALIISAYIIFIENTNNTKYKLIFYFALLIQVFTGFLSGMKENALEPILYTIIVFLIAGKRIPKNIIFIGLFALAILYPINNAYREVISNPYLNKGSSIVNMSRAIKKVLTQPLDETLLGGVESYADRGSMFPFLIYVTNIEEKWTEIVSDIVRFCKEFELRTDIYISEIKDLLSYYTKEYVASGSDTNPQIYYALTKMPLQIMEQIYLNKYHDFKNNIDNEINGIIEVMLPDKKAEIIPEKTNNKYIIIGFINTFGNL